MYIFFDLINTQKIFKKEDLSPSHEVCAIILIMLKILKPTAIGGVSFTGELDYWHTSFFHISYPIIFRKKMAMYLCNPFYAKLFVKPAQSANTIKFRVKT